MCRDFVRFSKPEATRKSRVIYGVEYPAESLTGMGSIHGYPVQCVSAEWMVKFHTGYRLDENDYRDVMALCQRFGIAVPAEYDRFC
jgi:lincosamide nucleotidyltransferase A/C/D/E